jgi:hypothetical protein
MLVQLIRYAGNLADLRGLSRSSCRANVAKQGDDEDDDLINRFKEFGELNVVIVDTAARTDSVGEMGTLFLADAKQTGSTIHRTIVKVPQRHHRQYSSADRFRWRNGDAFLGRR